MDSPSMLVGVLVLYGRPRRVCRGLEEINLQINIRFLSEYV